jgi:tetratricopeptide (TPR) repeat protein
MAGPVKRASILLLLLAAARAEDRQVAQFRLRKDPSATVKGWIVQFDDAGFLFETFGRDRRITIKWTDVVDEDARRLRIAFKLDLTEEEEKGLIPGQELCLKGGGSVRGLLNRVDEDGTHWMRVEGLLLPYPEERVDRVEEVQIQEGEAYTAEEVYVRRLERRPPRTTEEHRRLADYLYDIGNFQGAKEQYDKALALDPALEAAVAARLGAARDYLEDKVAAGVFAKEKSDAVLNGKWKEAIESIRSYGQANPAARRRAEKLAAELEEKWFETKQARYHIVKNEEFDRAIRAFLVKKPTLEEAKSWATGELPDVVKDRTGRRLGLTVEELAAFLGTKAKGALHWASYWTGTFIVSKRAAVGKSTKREIRGDPDDWWAVYDDANTRASWLKAYAAERLDLFEVVQVNPTPCERCGGTGQVTKMSLRALPDGRQEWQERCPRCFGACDDRGIGYR